MDDDFSSNGSGHGQSFSKSHYARQYIGKNEELFHELTSGLAEVLLVEGYFQ